MSDSQSRKNLDQFINRLLNRIQQLENRVSDIEGTEERYITVSTGNVSNPPTDSELDSLFGTPSEVGTGFRTFINDNGAGANFYLVASDGARWWVFSGTLAV